MKRSSLLFLFSFIVTTGFAQKDSCTGFLRTDTEIKTLSVLWQQHAAEYRALCYQAFNIAKLRIDQYQKDHRCKTNLAIITDLDETILDNSYVLAKKIKENKELIFPQDFTDWVKLVKATAVPGAVEFLQYAKSEGFSIFYISNRLIIELDSTLSNLKKLKLPDADTAHMLFRNNTSSKESRRNAVEKNYKVVLLLGDNLNDFTEAFENKTIATRFIETDKAKTDWGNKFIVLPNSTYGEWEKILYSPEHKTVCQKNLKRLELLIGY